MESVTHPNIPNQALRAVRFLNGLDKRRYRNLLSHVENEAVSGAAEYPATLDRAFSRAVNYRLEMNATPRVGKPDPPMPSAAVMLVEPTPPRTRPPRRAGKSTSTTPTSTTSKIDSKPPSGTIKPKFVHKPCKLCGETTHYMDACPLADELVRKFKHTNNHSVHFTEGGVRNMRTHRTNTPT
jgi:hypothetical protein